MSNEAKHAIQNALGGFAKRPLRDASIALLESLGYRSEKRLALANTPKAFRAQFENGRKLNPDNALLADWQSVEFLFQLTDDEIKTSSQGNLVFESKGKYNGKEIHSYLFLAIELKESEYTRTELSVVTREINKLFDMPAMLLFKHGDTLTLSVINRRLHKRDASKDVLEKVTLIKDIRFATPHRAHIEILYDLSFDALRETHDFTNFVQLHEAWRKTLDSSALTKEFYTEIANWYFWAREHARFPAHPSNADADGKPSLPLIRLLTRLVFCWFLREKSNPQTGKGLLPDDLFTERGIQRLLKDATPDACSYYPAILQNLFFATLNTELTKAERRFIDEGDGQRSNDHMIHTLWRHKRLLRDPAALARLLRDVPFLNGGLFECLDDRVPHGKSNYTDEIRIDGFSNDPKKQPKLPNFLFFGPEQTVNLAAAYGDDTRRRETVRPLLTILHRYKFTLTENTPLEQEVALDPELLGHVFENLLAAYNPETGTVARKATGSFYTPRVVVDWMVDQALLAHLESKVKQTILSASESEKEQTGLSASLSPPLQPYDPEAETNRTRRRLPHWFQQGCTYYVTFRLADSLPQEKLRQWMEEKDIWLRHHPEPWSDADWQEYDQRFTHRMEGWLDAGYGECHLARPEVREIVEACLTHFDGQRYDLGDYVVMPNHVHLLITPKPGHELSEIMQGIKGVSSRKVRQTILSAPPGHQQTRLPASRHFWMDESFDHIVRSGVQLARYQHYIAENPARAGLKPGTYSLRVKQTILSASGPEKEQTGLSASESEKEQTGLSASESEKEQTGLSASPSLNARLRRLLSWEDTGHDFTPKEVERLIDAIDHLKVLDPACGSGAFPMGMLQKLVHVLRKLDPENKGWRRRQEAALDTFESAPARDEARQAIERAFARDNDDYGRKLYLIENCLYGVDIQPIACQIAKLRFFISLICDQSIDPQQPNYGILPLPNLETKIVAANTLLGLQRGQLLLGSDRVRQLERELQQVRHDYFTARRYKDKKALRARDKELCEQLAAALTDSGECSPYDAQRLAAWNPYDTNKAAPFFDPAWMFGLSVEQTILSAQPSVQPKQQTGLSAPHVGFDIVIGNPPYVRQEELKNVTVTGSDGKPRPLKDALRDQYECYTGTADLYVYFFERSFQLLKLGGVLSFVTSNKYMRAAYGERLRAYLFYATHPRAVLDFGDAPVFTSIAYPCILVAEKTRHVERLPDPQSPTGVLHATNLPPADWHVRVHTWNPGKALLDFPDLFDAEAHAIPQRDLKPDGWRLESPVGLRLLERMRKAGKPLREYVGSRVYRGLTTGLNEAFVVDEATRGRFIAEAKSSAEVLKPFLRGRDIERWHGEPVRQYLITIPSSENVNHPWSGKSLKEAERIFAKTYPTIHEHLESFRKALIERDDQGKFHWELRSCTYYADFEKPKIMSTKVSIRPTFALDRQGCYLGNTSYFIPVGDLYVLALLNSNLYEGYARRVFVEKQGGWYEVQPDGLEAFPIPTASAEQRLWCERLAEALIWLHSPGRDGPPGRPSGERRGAPGGRALPTETGLLVAYIERWLNGLVYELFFPGELRACRLALFDATAKLAPPDLAKIPEKQKLAALQALQAAAERSPLPALLADLAKVEEIRIIEEAGKK